MKKKKLKPDNFDAFDELIFNIAEENYEKTPTKLHNHLLDTINNLENTEEYSHTTSHKKSNFKCVFQETIENSLKRPLKTAAISFLSLIIITGGVVGARQMSDKLFNKDTVRLDNIGIANEFIFTSEMESSLKQNVPLKLVDLGNDYYINISSVLVDEINMFVVFELHSKEKVTDDLRFAIRDLQITDENGNILYLFNNENPDNINKGTKSIYNTDSCIREMFFMFGNDNSHLKNLTFTFSEIDIFAGTTKERTNVSIPTTVKKLLNFEKTCISLALTKENYNTIQEYMWDSTNIASAYTIEKAILTNTGLYILTNAPIFNFTLSIKDNSTVIKPLYQLPLKRTKKSLFQSMIVYDIKNIPNDILLYNNLNTNVHKLIQKNEK